MTVLTESSFQSITTQYAKTIDQNINSVTNGTIGKFGITANQLVDLGNIKPGVINFATDSLDKIEGVLSDPAAWTGLDGVNSLTDVLNSEVLQNDLVKNSMEMANDVLTQAGALLGTESLADTATMLGSSMLGTGEDVLNAIEGVGDQLLNSAMSVAGKASQFADALAAGPGEAVLNSITENVSAIGDILNTIDNISEEALDSNVDSLINNVRIPEISTIAKQALSHLT